MEAGIDKPDDFCPLHKYLNAAKKAALTIIIRRPDRG
jgi:hypothetical protein